MPNQYEVTQANRLAAMAEPYGMALVRLDQILGVDFDERIPIRKINIRCGKTHHTETLVIVSAWDEDGLPAVAFHSADNAASAFMGTINRYLNGQLEWKEDAYYKG